MRNLLLLSLVVLFLSGCVTATVQTQNTKSLATNDFSGIQKVVLVPIKVEVKESGIGSLEKLPERSEKATNLVLAEITSALANKNGVEVVKYEPVDTEQQILLDEYVGLYQRVAGSAESIQYMGSAWKDRPNFDYTLGDGLAFLREATGTDKAIFVFGEDIVSSGGKKALAVLAMMGGVGVNPGGVAVLHVGLVDLNTGHLLWSNSSASQGMSLDQEKSVRSAMADILATSPFVTAP